MFSVGSCSGRRDGLVNAEITVMHAHSRDSASNAQERKTGLGIMSSQLQRLSLLYSQNSRSGCSALRRVCRDLIKG